MTRPIRALSLISGGLDSLLATKLILDQGIDVTGIHFYSGFFGRHPDTNHEDTIVDASANDPLAITRRLGIELKIIDAIDAFKPVFLKPAYGYGAHLNPCLDCKIFMVRAALAYASEHNYDFLISGEVVGQRPKSQLKHHMQTVVKVAETDERLLRPLSAKILSPTLPEKRGWVNRELLCDFSGRSRKPQFALARSMGFNTFPQPAGGCVLTDKQFCARLSDHFAQTEKDYDERTLALLRVGRHFRLGENKIIVGRDEKENRQLETLAGNDYHLCVHDGVGAIVLVQGEPAENKWQILADITAYYSKHRQTESVEVSISRKGEGVRTCVAYPKNYAGEKSGIMHL